MRPSLSLPSVEWGFGGKPSQGEREQETVRGTVFPANEIPARFEVGDIWQRGHQGAGRNRADSGPIAGKTIPRIVFWPGSYLQALRRLAGAGICANICGQSLDLLLRVNQLISQHIQGFARGSW